MPNFFVNCTPFHHSKPLEGVSAESALYISAQCISNKIHFWTDIIFMSAYLLAFLLSLGFFLRQILQRKRWGVAGNLGLAACGIQFLLFLRFLVHFTLTSYFARAFFTSLPVTLLLVSFTYVVTSWFSVVSSFSRNLGSDFSKRLRVGHFVFCFLYVVITYTQLFLILLYEKSAPLNINLIMGVSTTWMSVVVVVVTTSTYFVGKRLEKVLQTSLDIEQDKSYKRRLEKIKAKVKFPLLESLFKFKLMNLPNKRQGNTLLVN